ncbi:MAG: hypothetical protein IPL18_13575 [Sphingomonadales bacterium]|nr:hypothetical protein [Sphingomonadales bacterium]
MYLRRIATAALAITAPLALSGCLLLPGDFQSDLTVMKSGDFSFSYKGQIQLVGLTSLLNSTLDAEGAESTEFTPSCWGPLPGEEDKDEKKKNDKKEKARAKAEQENAENEAALGEISKTSAGTAASQTSVEDAADAVEGATESEVEAGEAAANAGDAVEAAADAADAAAEAVEAAGDDYEERDCTVEEEAEQKKDWDEQQTARKKEKEQAKKMFSMLLGGVDPSDPKSIDRFTKGIERMAAWNKVEHLGNGVFRIDYATKGRLVDDFAFPVIPRYALGNPMVHITRWDNGRVRVEAPSFHNDPELAVAALMGAGSFIPGMPGPKKDMEPVEIKGTFTVRTDAKILANNTEEGPSEEGGLSILSWEIGPKTFGPPMVLLKLIN